MFFKKSKQEADILPPPPPFPKLDLEKLPPIKERIPKPVEEKPKKSFFETLGLVKTPEEKEAMQRAKEEKRKAKEEGKKQKEEEKKRLKQEKETLKKQKKEEKIKEKPTPEPLKIEKPPEISQAEQEIEKAIKELKKPKKSLFKLFKHREKVPKPEIKLPEIPKKELPPPEIEEPTDDVTAIKHKIHDARNALMDFDLDKAKIIYIKMMRMYNNLRPEKQAIVYEQIKDLYDERKNAESLKTKS